jgi:nitroimidazol reductase NimA-like FMN-containing flavoprotein (pyridoxamine 5'-phosphate oxidase superfamily)
MSQNEMDRGSVGSDEPSDGGIVPLGDEECRAILREQRLCVLAMTDGDAPYAIPLFYGFDGENVWLGIAEGRKTELLDRNPLLCLSVNDVGPGDAWRSVLVTGRATWVTDPEQRAKGIQVLMQHNRRRDRPVTQSAEGAPRRRRSGGRIVLVTEAVITGRARR